MPPATATQARILIVEDDPDAALLLDNLLRAARHQVVAHAESGEAALALAAATRPDLVIMDIVLPGGLDGIETAALLAERQDIPVLYLTAYSDEELYARARATSPLAYLHKPFNARELQRAIDVALDRHALLRRLKASEAHLAEAQAVAHIGSWQWHLAEDRVDLSDELLCLLELERGGFEPCFDTFLGMAHEADRSGLLRAVETLLRGEDAGDVDVRLDRPDGSERVLRLRGSARFDAQGRPATLVGTALDITAEWLARREAERYRAQLESRVAERTAELSAANASLKLEIENRLRVEEALWRNEQRYRGLVDNLPEPVVVMQHDQVVFANPALARLLALPAATALLGRNLVDLVHPDSLDACAACKQATFSGEAKTEPVSLKLRHDGGGSVEVEALTFAFDYEGGPAILAVMRDISARRAMEQVTERFRVAQDSSPDGVCLIDPASMRFVDVNATACARLGYTREELLGLGPQDILPLYNKHMLREFCAAALAGDAGGEIIQTLHQRKDGRTYPVEIRIRPFTAAGQPLIIAVASDISERLRAEAELRESNDRFRQLAESIDEVFWVRDLEENRFLYVNPAYERLYGKSVESLYRHPRSFMANIHPEDRDRVAEAHDRQRARPDGLDIEYRVVIADQVRWMWVRTFPIRDAQGRVYRMVGVAKEVTERRRSEEQFRTLIQASMDGFWLTDRHGRLLDCNDAACRISGYERNELLTLSVPDLEASETPAQTAEHIQRITEHGFDRFETRHRRKDGEEIDIDASVYFRASQEGGHFFVFLRDISARKRMEAALRNSEARARSVLRAAPVGIGVLVDRVFLEVNDTMTAMTGYAREELLRQSARMLYASQAEFELVGADKYRQIHEHGLGSVETRWRRKDGEILDIALSSSPIAAHDLSQGVTFTAQDITERKRAEAALRNSEMRFRLLFEHSPLGIAMADLDRRLIQVNQAMCDMLGYSAEELTQKTFLEITHPDDRAVNRELHSKAREDGLPSYRLTKRYLSKNGDVVWIDLNSALIRDQFGAPLYSLGIMENITERVNAEERRQAHEARQRDALVREVHHRIKNNLQGVINLLRQDIATYPETRSSIEAAIAQINTIAVVHGLQGRVPQSELRLRELLKEVCGAVAALAMVAHTPRVDDQLQGDAWLDSGGAVTIALILNELIQNALKHGRGGDGEGVALALSGDGGRATVRIVNPGGPLPAGFDLGSGQGCGTGLDLIRTLLPRKGATLTLREADGVIETEFQLCSPLLSEAVHSAPLH